MHINLVKCELSVFFHVNAPSNTIATGSKITIYKVVIQEGSFYTPPPWESVHGPHFPLMSYVAMVSA